MDCTLEDIQYVNQGCSDGQYIYFSADVRGEEKAVRQLDHAAPHILHSLQLKELVQVLVQHGDLIIHGDKEVGKLPAAAAWQRR